ncbi:hypothetical protein BKA65DRAFT_593973 [Rhexocercosporidium sp. MPI-PUGE-AT-0058]|nr:hypothetical protein BKA65DRAFT_593973 [Rhexocercosporidium sp. MPI-PUGE-AT-0058]
MSGFEVVGVVLGVLPLLISAAEHYKDIFAPFRRLKRCAPELEMYQQQLKTQKTIFENHCESLLTALTSRQSAKEMLREKDHPSWHDDSLRTKIAEQLGNAREACEATVQMIAGKLKSIEEDAKGFGIILQESIPLRSLGDKVWRSQIQKKLKFCFSESQLNEYLNDLRKPNQDFHTLAKQTGRRDKQESSSSTPNSVTAFPPKKVEESRLIQRASAQLYDAIGKACQHHTEHYAHFQLLPKNIGSTETEASFVPFNIAFTHDQIGALATLEPVSGVRDSATSEEDENTEERTLHADIINLLHK